MSPSQILRTIYPNDPHATISATCDLKVTSDHDLDLLATLQFTNRFGHAAMIDFSAFIWVIDPTEDNLGNLAEEKEKIRDEMHAFDNLLAAVEEAHAAFTTNALQALHTMNGLAVA